MYFSNYGFDVSAKFATWYILPPTTRLNRVRRAAIAIMRETYGGVAAFSGLLAFILGAIATSPTLRSGESTLQIVLIGFAAIFAFFAVTLPSFAYTKKTNRLRSARWEDMSMKLAYEAFFKDSTLRTLSRQNQSKADRVIDRFFIDTAQLDEIYHQAVKLGDDLTAGRVRAAMIDRLQDTQRDIDNILEEQAFADKEASFSNDLVVQSNTELLRAQADAVLENHTPRP